MTEYRWMTERRLIASDDRKRMRLWTQFFGLPVLVRQEAMSLKKLPDIVVFVLNSRRRSENFN
jgi:hypothetical protein